MGGSFPVATRALALPSGPTKSKSPDEDHTGTVRAGGAGAVNPQAKHSPRNTSICHAVTQHIPTSLSLLQVKKHKERNLRGTSKGDTLGNPDIPWDQQTQGHKQGQKPHTEQRWRQMSGNYRRLKWEETEGERNYSLCRKTAATSGPYLSVTPLPVSSEENVGTQDNPVRPMRESPNSAVCAASPKTRLFR